MEFSLKDGRPSVDSDKKMIAFDIASITVDGLCIDMAGEYEKGGFLIYVLEQNGQKLYQLRVEGYRVGYIPSAGENLSKEALDFLGDLDILILPADRTSKENIDKIEPRLLVAFGELAGDYFSANAMEVSSVDRYKVRESELAPDTMFSVYLA